ncbi:MAG: cytochrome c oxidase assembly protein [Mycobacterium sp.]
MTPAIVPLTWSAALTTWRWDTGAALVILVLGGSYTWAYRRGDSVTARYAWSFAIGLFVVLLATMSMLGVYGSVLFWVRALQVLLLLFVGPFFLAMGRPVSVISAAAGPAGRDRLDRLLATPVARCVAHPATTSIAMLATPWLLYLTPWYVATLDGPAVMTATGAVLLIIGFCYFYARLQTDPVPRRYSQLISLVISIVESIGDGLLGIVLWLGPLIAVDYYTQLGRQWGPSMRVDQSIGAGVLWLVGDVLGVPFIIVLMRLLSADEKAHAQAVDAELDNAEIERAPEDSEAPSGLWWENDPQLRDRMGRA